MNKFIFENGTKAIFGKGCVKEYLACFLRNYGDTVMLAYGGGAIKKNGIYDEILAILKTEGKNIIEFDGIMANPTYNKVLEGAKLARENHADVILAAGGGSVMDCCKAVSLATRYEGDVWDNFWAKPGIIDFEPLPLGVIVTVAGTGSEMNGGAAKFARFAKEVWKIPAAEKSETELAYAGVEALADFIREIGLPTTLRELGVTEETDLKQIADSCACVQGAYKMMNKGEILEIFRECF